MEAKDGIRILETAIEANGGPPEFIRRDNGPEFIARAVQDWIRRRGFKTLFLNREAFATLLEAKVLGEGHRKHWPAPKPLSRCL